MCGGACRGLCPSGRAGEQFQLFHNAHLILLLCPGADPGVHGCRYGERADRVDGRWDGVQDRQEGETQAK